MKYTGVVIADIHIGAIPIQKIDDELDTIFFNHLRNMVKLDFLIIDGDLFDKKLFLCDDGSSYIFKFINKLKPICILNNTKVRIVYGTESHDADQYDCFSSLTPEVDINIIKYVHEEELFPDFHVLYIPEEYIIDKKEHYGDFFKNEKKYNYIFGHGIIREAMREAAISNETKSARKKVPVFSTVELKKMCKGQTYFGHYHVNTDMDDVFYVGSFTRWQFGEEGAKGFYELTCNTKKNIYENKFVENTICDIYTTIPFGYNNSIFKSDEILDKELSRVDEIIKTNALEHVRFEFNIPKDYENPEYLINYLKERYKNNTKIKINLVHGYVEEKKRKDSKNIEEDKHSFIFDKNMDIVEKTRLFISLEYGAELRDEDINMYLNSPLSEILSL